jgi:uncharacterized membrane protein (DUF4010 family)
MEQSLFWSFLLATALGALIWTEREMPWSGTKPGGASGFWGIRSYALLALFWAIAAWMDTTSNSGNFWKWVGILTTGCIVLAGYVYSSFSEHRMGVTSEFAALLTYFIGVIIGNGDHTIGVILAVLILLLLSAKEYFSELQKKFSRVELGHSLKFAVISLVALPLLPDQRFSFLDIANWIFAGTIEWVHPVLIMPFFNPYSIWFFVVIMAGVEYIGYILSKVLWNRGGIVASGAIGGLISSTATTAAMTRKSTEHPGNRNAYASATLIASCIMFLRVVAISGFYSPAILATIILPAGIMFLTLTGAAYYYYHVSKKDRLIKAEEANEYESPFRLLPALEFAAIIVIIKFVAGIGLIYQAYINQSIFYPVLWLLSGLADVDAITQDMASKTAEWSLPMLLASSTILIAVMSNNFVKASIARKFWEKIFGKSVMYGFWISILSGLIVIILMNLLG